MLSEKETTHLSKLLSLVLRHNPGRLELALDAEGWVAVAELLTQAQAHQVPLTREKLVYIVETNAKQRFRFNEDQSRIRANQGHSVEVALGYQAVTPPPILYHGTAVQNQAGILAQGLRKMNRLQVHLSADVETALTVGRRHGRPLLFEVDAQRMHQDGLLFYRADNGVWLTDVVPAGYLRVR